MIFCTYNILGCKISRKFIVSDVSESLHKRIINKDAKICVIGLGQVGLPTALTFCDAGFDVIGNDIDENLLATLNSKKSPFEEPNLQNSLENFTDKKKFQTTPNIEKAVENSDVLIICVATPITENVRTDLSALEKVCKSLSELSLKDKLIIIESSIPPRTFEDLVLPLLNKKNDLVTKHWIAFVPERLAPGQAFSEIRTTPRVIGKIDEKSGLLAKALYEQFVDSEILVTSIKVAEISKLVENTFRDVNVAFANEVGLICENYGIDFAELLRVCNSHPRVKLLNPGPGVGGPCLPKDPYLLLNPRVGKPIESKIIHQARRINDNMPSHVIELAKKALKQQNKDITKSTIAVLGVSYKANISDTRLSPSEKIISQLVEKGCKVYVFDPKTKENFGGETAMDVWDAIRKSDVLIIVTDHEEFKQLELKKIKDSMEQPTIVDTRRIFDRKEAENLGINYLAVGYGGKL